MIAEASQRGSQIVLLPELWSTGYDLGHAAEHARTTERVLVRLTDLAKERSLFIIGSLLSAKVGRLYNRATILSPQGDLVGEYDKIHLFRLMEEEKYFAPGTEPPVFDLPWGKGALAICYDLRFPELFRKYALRGARVVFLPAEWPYPRLEAWRVLLRARAIENQFFMVGCNRVGESKGMVFFGHSGIYDPWGEPVLEGGEEERLLTAEIDLDVVDEARRKIPVFEDRREELYR
ncbi:MAG: carbon-nitrogen family hydrolase [Anaerolineae bacterium]|nr:carbon-nitrogen family hydrolase [Anaerolineae bacterium]